MNSPFNESKYQSLLEGLEISELNISELERTFRIDPEFYKKENLNVLDLLDYKNPVPITEFGYVSDGNHMKISNYFTDKDGVPYYRGQDIYNFFIEQSANPLKIEERAFNFPYLKRSHLEKGDVLLSIVGAIIGNLSLVKTEQKATCSCKLAIIRPKNIQPEFLAIFLKSKYGQNQIQKFRRGTAQTGLILEDFDQLVMPNFSEPFKKIIAQNVEEAFRLLEKSKHIYSNAENLLLENIGLRGLELSEGTINIKSMKEAFLRIGRLDAEYFQPKYEDYLNLIYKYPNGYERLGEICNLKDKNFNPKDKEEYNYIELSNIGKSGEITGCTTALGSELPTRARRKINTNDVIISSIEGSLESCALVPNEYDNALCSTGFYVINSEEINAETLLVLFKSELMQNILKQNCSGTILTAINKNEFENIPLPILDKDIQEKIKSKATESFQSRKKSEQLLEMAKQAVEIAIEQDETIATNFIDTFLAKIY